MTDGMDRLQEQLDAARDHLEPEWDEARGRRVYDGLGRRDRARRRRTLALAVVALMTAGGAVTGLLAPADPMTVQTASTAPDFRLEGERRVVLARGAIRVEARSPVVVVFPSVATEVELVRGQVLCSVVDGRVELVAEQGEAWTRFRGEGRPLAPGQSLRIGPPPSAPPPAGELAAPPDAVGALLELADAARDGGNPLRAVAPLRAILAAHRDDPRAPMAAFTLGKLLLDELDRPAEALAAFDTALALSPDGPLAEDALARQVAAASRLGDPRAPALADAFLRRFPDSPRAAEVRRLGARR